MRYKHFNWYGYKIRKVILDRGFTISYLAKELNVSRETIYIWMKGTAPSVDNLIGLCDFLGVAMYYFMEE